MKCLFLFFTLLSTSAFAQHHHDDHDHDHGELPSSAQTTGDNSMDTEKVNNFRGGLTDVQIALVNVEGMVCDFCARGIEKTFAKNKSVKKTDIDLKAGTVLIAFDKDYEVSFEEIKKKIQANGQNAVGMKILELDE